MIAGAVVSVAFSPSPRRLSLASPCHLSHVLSVAGLEPPVLLSSKSLYKLELHSDCCSPVVPLSPLSPLVSPSRRVSFLLSLPFPLPFPLLSLSLKTVIDTTIAATRSDHKNPSRDVGMMSVCGIVVRWMTVGCGMGGWVGLQKLATLWVSLIFMSEDYGYG
jgi:hypothetical protein